MFSKIISGGVVGVSACIIWVEVDMDRGLPAFAMVGSPAGEVRESRERVTVALKNAGLALPTSHITVNLAPADVHKEGTGFDLPVAVGILQAMSCFAEGAAEGILFLGELGLNGEVKKVPGVLPVVQAASAAGIGQCVVPWGNAGEGAAVPGITVRGAGHIRQVLDFLQCGDPKERDRILPAAAADQPKSAARPLPDFAEICGQQAARRAAEIAAAGFHNLLMIGPPGVGKSMIAARIPGILPPLTREESMEVTGIYSVAGLLKEGQTFMTDRPFQSPHHSASRAALIGGGPRPRPGLVSLAHRGVLFMDELPEFGRTVIDSLRQPMEEREVCLARAGSNVSYPADFMLIGAMNPCPCGYYPDRNRCRCSPSRIRQYQGRVSGPILERIDLWTELQPPTLKELQGGPGETSGRIRERVQRAQEAQKARFSGTACRFNADIQAPDLERFCALGSGEKRLMGQLYDSLGMGARACHRMLKVARTIADLAGEERVREEHLLEAAAYRPCETARGQE